MEEKEYFDLRPGSEAAHVVRPHIDGFVCDVKEGYFR